MTTVTVQIPDKEAKALIDFVKKLRGKTINDQKLAKIERLSEEINAGIKSGKKLTMQEVVDETRIVMSKGKLHITGY